MDYITLTPQDQLTLARDRLRGLESDHYRLTLAPDPHSEGRMNQMADQIKELQKEVKALERKEERRRKAAEPKD